MAAPLIGHDGMRKTVTFSKGEGGEGPTEGAYRTARLYSRISTATFGASAAILTVVSMWLMVDFASDLATTWPQVVKFSIIAIAISLATTGLPVGAGLLAHSNPGESRLMMKTWGALLVIAGLAMLFFVLRLDGSPQRSYSPAAIARADEIRHGLEYLGSTDWALWSSTGKCERPSRDKQAACETLLQRRQNERDELAAIEAGVWSERWTPGALIGTGRVAGLSDALRRLLAALLTLVAMAGAGVLARWGAMGHAEAFRQADGIVAPPAAAPSVSPGGPPALVSPLETTELWFQGRVLPDPNGRLSPSAAYLDYEAACQVNGLPPMSSSAFYNLLAAKAKTSGGAITRVKIGGIHHYAGWSLATADMGQVSAEGGEMRALPYRSS